MMGNKENNKKETSNIKNLQDPAKGKTPKNIVGKNKTISAHQRAANRRVQAKRDSR